MNYNAKCVLVLCCLLACCSPVLGDRLPVQTPENQLWTTTSVIEAVGATIEDTTLDWHLGDQGLKEFGNPLTREKSGEYFSSTSGGMFDTVLTKGVGAGSIAYMIYKDNIMSNGGQISEVKSFSLDTHEKTEGLYNIETEKVLTYTSQNGSHLMGSESYILDVAGMWGLQNPDDIVCVFSRSNKDSVIPAFCNKVTASSRLRSITTAQIESIGSATMVGKNLGTPAALLYEIAVTPDSNSASGYADGIVSTTFTVSVQEGRTDFLREDPLADWGWRYQPANAGMQNNFAWGFQQPTTTGGGVDMYFLRDPSPSGDLVQVFIAEGVNFDWYYIGGGGPIPPGAVDPQCMPGSSTCLPGDSLPASYPFTFRSNADGTFTVVHKETGVTYNINPYDSNPATAITLHIPGYDELATTITTIDTATVSGGISNFVKAFNYKSGIKCSNC